MPEENFIQWVSESCFIVVDFVQVNGRMVSFVVRLVTQENESDFTVARYDTAHGLPHLDIVNKRGRLVDKQWLFGKDIAEAFTYAINDFKKNHEHYHQEFLKRDSSSRR